MVSSAAEGPPKAPGADAYLSKPVDRHTLLETLSGLHARTSRPLRALVIDDEEVATFLLREALPAPGFEVIAV